MKLNRQVTPTGKPKAFMTGLKPNAKVETLLQDWSKKRVVRLLELSIRSHILKHTCISIIKRGGEAPVMQLVYMFQDMGYESVDTEYKFVKYIEKINMRYDLPLSFHYNNRYVYFDAAKI